MSSCTVRVPGKIMLVGEYSVLKGGAACAHSVDRFLNLSIRENGSSETRIFSDLWPQPKILEQLSPADVVDNALLDSVYRCCAEFAGKGIDVRVKSDLDVKFGMGSSSAIRLATRFAFYSLIHQGKTPSVPERWDLAREGFLDQKKQQKLASGYDIATQNIGGFVIMRPFDDDRFWPGSLTRLGSLVEPINRYVHPVVGGDGAPTARVAADTVSWLDEKNRWPQLGQVSEALLAKLVEWLHAPKEQQRNFFSLIAEHRQIFAGSPHEPLHVIKKLQSLPGCDETWSFKTTGAGGEDALLLFGEKKVPIEALQELNWRPAPFRFSSQGTAFTHKEGSNHGF